MGEMADWLIDQTMDAYPEWSPFRSAKKRLQCRYCRSQAVYWHETQYGWRLFNKNDDAPHTCKEYFEFKEREERAQLARQEMVVLERPAGLTR